MCGSRRRDLTVGQLRTLLRQGRVAFVVADVGRTLNWIVALIGFVFWKTEVRPHIPQRHKSRWTSREADTAASHPIGVAAAWTCPLLFLSATSHPPVIGTSFPVVAANRRFCRSGVARPRSRGQWNGTPFMPLVDEQWRGWQPVRRTKDRSIAGIPNDNPP